jgi:hypothetical protein
MTAAGKNGFMQDVKQYSHGALQAIPAVRSLVQIKILVEAALIR